MVPHLISVPKKYKDYRMCLVAVTNDPWALQHVPLRHKTYELCLVAAKNKPQTISYVPTIHITFEFICIVLDSDMAISQIYKFVDLDLLTQSQQEFLKLKYELFC